MEDRIGDTAREAFGFTALRPGQREAIEAVLAGRDTLAVLSTGSGKSAIYQIAGLLIDGPTLVVSPLIALQQDQVDNIEEKLPGEAAELNAGVSRGDRRETLSELDAGELEFLFLAPEQLGRPELVARLREARPSLLVVDEAHCISEWGHDFRPDYLRLGPLVETLGHPTVLALTATASPPVRAEIAARLRMAEPEVVIRGFDRPNIHLAVRRFHEARRKHEAIVAEVVAAEPPGLVYAATRKGVEELAGVLRERGVDAVAYHAGLRDRLRDELLERFMAGEIDVIVATIAFGMGVDKADVRWVFHLDVPESVDAYYQQVGRSGRDGKPARAVLFYRAEDLGRQRFFAGGSLELDTLAQVDRAVREHGDDGVDPAALRDDVDISETRLAAALNRLEEAGAVRLDPGGAVHPAPGAPPVEQTAALASKAEADRHEFDRSRVDMIRAYAEHDGCRRAFVLSYFGEAHARRCGHCDNCEAGLVADEPEGEAPFPTGARVEHGKWGPGVVQRYEGEQMVVLFDEVGYKTLAVAVVVEHALLRSAA